MKKIVFFNTEDQKDLAIEQKMAEGLDVELLLCNDRPDEELVETCRDADGVVTIYSPFDGPALRQLDRLQVIAVQAIGYNNLDVAAASELGICLANVPDFCLYDVAVQTVAMTLSCTRHIVALNNRVKAGTWGYEGYKMHRLSGQTFGMIAFGNIPRTMAPMLRSFGMRLLTYDPWVSDEVLAEYGAERAGSLDELLAASDVVSVHCPLTDENIGLIGGRELAQMKPNAILINTARGRIIDEEALFEALSAGRIAGAGLDVLEREGDGDNPLYALENLVVTPHTAFYSEESMAYARRKALEQVLAVLVGKKAPDSFNLINPEAIKNARYQKG